MVATKLGLAVSGESAFDVSLGLNSSMHYGCSVGLSSLWAEEATCHTPLELDAVLTAEGSVGDVALLDAPIGLNGTILWDRANVFPIVASSMVEYGASGV